METENGGHGVSTIMPYIPANSNGPEAYSSDDWWPNDDELWELYENGSWWDKGGCDTGPVATELVPHDPARQFEIELAEEMKKDGPLFKLLLHLSHVHNSFKKNNPTNVPILDPGHGHRHSS